MHQDCINYSLFTVASILETLKLEEKACLKLIAADINKNDGVISYPSTLGQDCNTTAKLQLVLFLVRIICVKIIFINLGCNKQNR